MDNQSITHTRWNCTYHIVFIPKYRRKIMYGETKKDLVEIIKKLCEMKQVSLIDGRVCKDHIHMYVAIPPKMSVSEFMSYLKGKSTLMLFDRQTCRINFDEESLLYGRAEDHGQGADAPFRGLPAAEGVYLHQFMEQPVA